ncbi:MAG: V-type proton ATPase subunit E [Rickettsiales bacterium]|jgi:hypothetical protein|nr:V-type proton ATPase subunit E [Rickettsiales bacterium]
MLSILAVVGFYCVLFIFLYNLIIYRGALMFKSIFMILALLATLTGRNSLAKEDPDDADVVIDIKRTIAELQSQENREMQDISIISLPPVKKLPLLEKIWIHDENMLPENRWIPDEDMLPENRWIRDEDMLKRNMKIVVRHMKPGGFIIIEPLPPENKEIDTKAEEEEKSRVADAKAKFLVDIEKYLADIEKSHAEEEKKSRVTIEKLQANIEKLQAKEEEENNR